VIDDVFRFEGVKLLPLLASLLCGSQINLLDAVQDPTMYTRPGGRYVRRLRCGAPNRQVKVREAFKNGDDAFTEKRSVLFKQLHVSRFWDGSHQSFVYVVWTVRVINGSPKNSISAVVAQPWGSQAPDLSLMNSGTGSPAQ
jgi:hypothetical protein